MIRLTALTLVGATAGLATAADTRAQPVTLVEKPGHITEGVVTVDATPAQIYALVTDYANWRALLTDVLAVTVKAGGRADAKVRFRSRTLEHEVTVQFDNDPDHSINFRGIEGPPGGRASGSYWLAPIDGGTRTSITARLYLDVVGLAGVFVSDAKLRKMRQAKLRADLTDVARRFARPQVSAQPPRA